MKIKKKVIIVMVVIFVVAFFLFASTKMIPFMMIQAKQKMHRELKEKLVQTTKEMPLNTSFLDVLNHRVTIHTSQLNQWLSVVNVQLEKEIHELYLSIPIGSFTGIVFLYEKGPSLTCHFVMHDQLLSRYQIETLSLGINNTMLKVTLEIEIKGYVTLGFHVRELVMKESIPVILEYLQGEVPPYYPIR